MKSPSALGFTAVELVIAVSIVTIIALFAMPSIKDAIQRNRLATNANQFISALSLARNEAITRGVRVTVRKIAANWEDGWRAFTDDSMPGVLDGSDIEIRRHEALPEGYTLRGNNNFANFISFLPIGKSNNMGSFALCDGSSQGDIPQKNASRLIIINGVGRVRLGVDRDGNGIPEKEDGTDLSSCSNP